MLTYLEGPVSGPRKASDKEGSHMGKDTIREVIIVSAREGVKCSG